MLYWRQVLLRIMFKNFVVYCSGATFIVGLTTALFTNALFIVSRNSSATLVVGLTTTELV
jgi:hypothetical protein